MTRNAKAKGRLGQQEVRDKLLDTFPDLEPDDIKSTVMETQVRTYSYHLLQER